MLLPLSNSFSSTDDGLGSPLGCFLLFLRLGSLHWETSSWDELGPPPLQISSGPEHIMLCAERCVLLPLSVRPPSARGGFSSPVGHARVFRSP